MLRFTRGEKFYPASVDYIIGSSVLRQRNPDGTSILIDPAPNPDTLGAYASSDLFLNDKLGTLETIAADYASKANSIGYYAYVTLILLEEVPARLYNIGSFMSSMMDH